MTYNIDFLIAAMVILLLVLWYFLGQKRAEDLNNQVFLDVYKRQGKEKTGNGQDCRTIFLFSRHKAIKSVLSI